MPSTPDDPKQRFLWLTVALLMLGIGIRCVALTSPLLDAHSTRQTQTADAIHGMIVEPGIGFSSKASWRGDLDAKVAMEFPFYNYAVQGVWAVGVKGFGLRDAGGTNLAWIDLSGKLVSILFWALSFVFLQGIWRRLLTDEQAAWANLLFVVSPLSVFFGQAVMPEMLLQASAFGFLISMFLYSEKPTALRMAILTGAALVGLLTKMPAFMHLGLLAGAYLWWKNGWKFVLIRWTHWVALVVILFCLFRWSSFSNETNTLYFAEWAPRESLVRFLGDVHSRISPLFYLKISGYLSAFVITLPGVFVCLTGLAVSFHERIQPSSRFAFLWLLSVAVFYLVWGPRTAGSHSYYNLPALGIGCLFFGVGASAIRQWSTASSSARIVRQSVAVILLAAFLTAAVAGNRYLFLQDAVLARAIEWSKTNIPLADQVIVAQLHAADTVDYPHHPAFAYYTGLTTWMWTRNTPPEERNRAAARSNWLVVTHEKTDSGIVEDFRRKFKRLTAARELYEKESLEQFGSTVFESPEFSVYKRSSGSSDQ